jgi:hypothetical protein
MTKVHKIVNAETGEVIENPYTKEEIKEYELNVKLEQEAKALAEAKATAKVALLDRLGISAEEAALLLS